jgi:predicted nuclease of predicted toxin-antitoxin system
LKFHANENIEAEAVAFLRSSGHDVTYAAETQSRASDDEVLARATAEGRILITSDKDFGELCFRRALPSCGVVLIRGKDLTAEGRIRLLQRLLASDPPLETSLFIVLTDKGIRRRPFPPKPTNP